MFSDPRSYFLKHILKIHKLILLYLRSLINSNQTNFTEVYSNQDFIRGENIQRIRSFVFCCSPCYASTSETEFLTFLKSCLQKGGYSNQK